MKGFRSFTITLDGWISPDGGLIDFGISVDTDGDPELSVSEIDAVFAEAREKIKGPKCSPLIHASPDAIQ